MAAFLAGDHACTWSRVRNQRFNTKLGISLQRIRDGIKKGAGSGILLKHFNEMKFATMICFNITSKDYAV